MLKREWGAESNGKLPHLCFPSKAATQVPEFEMEDLPLGRISALEQNTDDDDPPGNSRSQNKKVLTAVFL